MASEGQCARSNKPFSSRRTQKWPRNLIIHAQCFYSLPVTLTSLWFVSICGPNKNLFTISICEVQRNALHSSLRLSIVYHVSDTIYVLVNSVILYKKLLNLFGFSLFKSSILLTYFVKVENSYQKSNMTRFICFFIYSKYTLLDLNKLFRSQFVDRI